MITRSQIIKQPELLKGMTREEIYSLLGNDYYSEYGGDHLVYIFKVYFIRKKAVVINFDPDGLVEYVDVVDIEEHLEH
ncbi:hypothetical protein ACFO4P_11085 [Epilithonimonas pallida]|uniref:Uncharacterized protein n=1 Tax=Epilithonimonas pallida TaxID=373671 RepID=A0ABY1R2A3_9FLAO|nr:hypothetical protein [Epilithonimonas pallida]SMP92347.1 hypothetical protein SAMN05421679_1046 [Epilithonimonas pallida]